MPPPQLRAAEHCHAATSTEQLAWAAAPLHRPDKINKLLKTVPIPTHALSSALPKVEEAHSISTLSDYHPLKAAGNVTFHKQDFTCKVEGGKSSTGQMRTSTPSPLENLNWWRRFILLPAQMAAPPPSSYSKPTVGLKCASPASSPAAENKQFASST